MTEPDRSFNVTPGGGAPGVARLPGLVAMLRDSVLVRRSSVMAIGIVGAKITTVLSLLVLARFYSTEAFGVLGIFQALVLSVSVVASLGYSLAVVLPPSDDEAASILWVAFVPLICLGLLTTGAAALLGAPMSRWLESPALEYIIWWAPVYLIGLGAYDILSHWSTRRHEFRRLARSSMLLAVAVAAIQVVAFSAGMTASGLIIGVVAGTALAAVVLAGQTWTADKEALIAGLSTSGLRAAASDHRQFPRYHAPATLISTASASLVPLGLGYLFGPAVVGLFWLADRVCGYMTNLIRQSMQQTFLSRAAETANESGAVLRLFHRTTLGLLLLALPLTLVLVLGGPLVFGIAFGADWIQAGVFARWLAMAWLFSLLNIPAVQLAAVYSRQNWTLKYSLGLAVCRVAAILIGGAAADPAMVLMLFAVGNAICSTSLIAGVSRLVRRTPKVQIDSRTPLAMSD